VLIGRGAEYDLYTAEVTRTFPASGRFTEAPARFVPLVLDAADACIAATAPLAKPSRGLHERAVRILTEGMVRLGLLKARGQLIKENTFPALLHAPDQPLAGARRARRRQYSVDGKPRPLERAWCSPSSRPVRGER